MGGKWKWNKMSPKVWVDQKWGKNNLFIYMERHESLFCHLKSNSRMLTNGLYLLFGLDEKN
jgi:hypothetical protein